MAYEMVDFQDIYNAVMEELKLQSSDTVSLNRVKRMINTIYIQEVVPAANWRWLMGNTAVTQKSYYAGGTVSVTPNSTTVTLSIAPAVTDGDSGSFLGWNFSVEGKNEIYKVSAHTALSTTVTIDRPFNNELASAATFKMWNDLVPLPTDLRETIECWHDHLRSPMEPKGLQDFRRLEAANPKAEGRPLYYSTYNYTSGDESTRYRQLRVFPSLSSYKTIIKIDYIKEATSLDVAGDEPLMPVEDRIVLFYGALSLAWGSLGRNPEEAARCRALFDNKLARMMGKTQDSQDKPRIEPDSIYIRAKKGSRIFGHRGSAGPSGASSYTAPSYLENVTINGATLTGNMIVNSGITIDGRDLSADAATNEAHIAASSDVHGIGGSSSVVGTATTQTLTNKSIDADTNTITNIENANIKAAAAIAVNKLAATTASRALASDASGFITASATTATELGYVSGVTSAIQTQIDAGSSGLSTHISDTTTHGTTGDIVGTTDTQTLTNKTLTGNTAVNLISGSGTLVLNTTGTATVPNATDTLVGKATTDVFTNKSISGATNTITNVSLTTGVTGTLPIANGGTNKTGWTAQAVPFVSATDVLNEDVANLRYITASTRFYVGAIGIATGQLNTNATSASNLAFYAAHTSNNVAVINSQVAHINTLMTHSNDTAGNGVILSIQRARGTTGSRTQAMGGDLIGTIHSNAYINSSTVTTHGASSIKFYLDEDAQAASCGGSMRFLTTPTGTVTPKERLRLQQDGSLEFAGATSGYAAIIPPATVTSYTMTLPDAQGAADSVLSNNGSGTLSWSTNSVLKSTLTTKGDIYAATAASTVTRLGVGSNGQVLKADSSTATGLAWGEGGGSGTGINYITSEDGADIGAWTTFDDVSAITDGTGGSPSVTYAVSTDSSMRGTTNFLFTHGSSDQRYEGFSYAFSIDPSDKGKVLQGSFEYLVASGTYADDGLAIYIYDVTNSTLIQPAPYLIKNSTIIEKMNFEFQTSSSSTSYRLIVVVNNATATAYTMRFDNWSVGPAAKLYGSATTDTVSWTPTGSWSANTTYTGQWRKNGDHLEAQVKISLAGAPTSAALTVNLPSGLTMDTAKLANINDNGSLDSSGAGLVAGTYSFPVNAVYNTTTSVKIRAHQVRIAGGNEDIQLDTVTQILPGTFASGDFINFQFRVPIAGWSSSVIMSSDADTRVLDFKGYVSTNQVLTANTTNLPITTIKDSHGSFSTATYTVPVRGDYQVSAVLINSSGSGTYFVYKNGTVLTGGALFTADTTTFKSGHVIVPDCIAGDTITIRNNAAVTALGDTGTSVSISKLSGPAQIAASELVAAVVHKNASGQTMSTNNSAQQVTFSTALFDTHGIFTNSDDSFTAPISGTYEVSAKVQSTGTNLLASRYLTRVMKGATYGTSSEVIRIEDKVPVASTEQTMGNGSGMIKLLAGEKVYLDVYGVGNNSASNYTISGVAEVTTFSIKRIGNY